MCVFDAIRVYCSQWLTGVPAASLTCPEARHSWTASAGEPSIDSALGCLGVFTVNSAARGRGLRGVAANRLMPLLMVLALGACQAGSSSSLPVTSPAAALPSPANLQAVEYDVRETLILVNEGKGQPSKQNVWVALVRDLPPYQAVRAAEITPSSHRLITDELGNRYAEFDLHDMPPGSTVTLQLTYRVEVYEMVSDLADCRGELPAEFIEAELHVESNNPQIVELSQHLAAGGQTACDQVRAFYDYVGNHLVYSYNGADWGAQAALGEMGADCTEYASLMIALSRAAGIPARYLEGLWVRGDESENAARTEHAWLEVYLPGSGWTPMDPTLGRSSVSREEYFAHLPPDHIVVTVGRNPSTLRGSSYWTHLYWPGNSTQIRVASFDWQVRAVTE